MLSPIALLALLPFTLAQSGWTCKQGAYPYCVHVMSTTPPSGSKWPTMIFMPGSGARGDLSNAQSLAQYDGHGKMISQYYSGQKSGPQKLAAENFLTIIPIAPDGSRHFDPDKVLEILNEVKSGYKVDSSRVYVSGYSMGSRGTWRFGVFHPEVIAAMGPSAGSAEDVGAATLQQEAAPATFPLLKNVINIPIHAFAGSADETAGYTDSQKTQAQIVKLGGKKSTLTILQGMTHQDMSTKPWTDTDLLSWFLTQSQSGSVSSSSSASVPSATKKKGHGTKSTSSPAPTVSANEDASDDDCDGEEPQTKTVKGDDCEGDEEEDTKEEDCEEAEKKPRRRSLEELPSLQARQADHSGPSPFKRHPSPIDLRARALKHRTGWHPHRMVAVVKR